MIIDPLIELAKEMREASDRGAELRLKGDEYAFYDALAANDSAVTILGDVQLRTIAHEVAKTVRENSSLINSLQACGGSPKLSVALEHFGLPTATD